jgi:hypothetical protein
MRLPAGDCPTAADEAGNFVPDQNAIVEGDPVLKVGVVARRGGLVEVVCRSTSEVE